MLNDIYDPSQVIQIISTILTELLLVQFQSHREWDGKQ